jgi:hypothetical protein
MNAKFLLGHQRKKGIFSTYTVRTDQAFNHTVRIRQFIGIFIKNEKNQNQCSEIWMDFLFVKPHCLLSQQLVKLTEQKQPD